MHQFESQKQPDSLTQSAWTEMNKSADDYKSITGEIIKNTASQIDSHLEEMERQKKVFSNIERQFFDIISQHPNFSRNEIMNLKSDIYPASINDHMGNCNLSKEQRDIFNLLLTYYDKKRNCIDDFVSDCRLEKGNIDGRKLYEKTFWGKTPKGEVDVVTGSMTICFYIKNADDFLDASGMSGLRPDISDDYIKTKVKGKVLSFVPSGVPNDLCNNIILINKSTEGDFDGFVKHETQHVCNRAIFETFGEKYSTERNSKDEISAHFATPGLDTDTIIKRLSQTSYKFDIKAIEKNVRAWQSLQDYFVAKLTAERSHKNQEEGQKKEEARKMAQSVLLKEKIEDWEKIARDLMIKK